MAEAYPLSWPEGRKRTKANSRERARFKTVFTAARDGLYHELWLMGARYYVLSTNLKLKPGGDPYSPRSLRPDEKKESQTDPGVAVYYELDGVQYAFCCDRWTLVEHNLQAIRKTVEALRGLRRWGTGEAIQRAFEGFKALPEPEEEPWGMVLGIASPHMAQAGTVQAAYRNKAKQAHPDAGGSDDLMRRLTRAKDAALKDIEGRR